jgi:glycosyltransferase involved in cell wall biosynthesis
MVSKVLHLLRKYDPREWGGTETAVAQLLNGLRDNDVSSVVYAPHTPDRDCDDTLAGYQVRRFHAFMPALGLSAERRDRLIAVGGNLMSFDLPVHLLREPEVSVVHSHALGRLGAIARIVALRRNLPFVVTIHGGYRDLPDGVRQELRAPLSRSIEYGKVFGALLGARRVVSRADAVITCNRREASLLREEMPPERVFHMPHGIPLARHQKDERETVRSLLDELGAEKYLLSVGRIDAVKNQMFLVEQHRALLESHPDVHLLLVGAVTDEEHAARIRERMREHDLGNRVHVLGAFPPDDPRLIGLAQLATAAVLASRSETFGLVILEAWAAGAPVVASRTSGATDLVEDGEDGLLFDIDDGPAYVDAVRRLLDEPERARAMGERGADKVAEAYDQAAVAKRLIELYEELRRRCAT